ncbi:MAG: methyltransferase domain-containing protein [Anaerolineae bacterium]
MKPVDRIGFRNWRSWVTAGAQGRVLEIGAGTGLNFAYYTRGTQVFAFDPDTSMLSEGLSTATAGAVITLTQARAEELPFPDESFDAATGTLVFCTIPDPARALAEVRRVLRPGAPLRLVEHVRGKNPLVGGVMDAMTPLWKRIAGGCHLNRDTAQAVAAAGFQVDRVQKRWGGLLIGIEAHK